LFFIQENDAEFKEGAAKEMIGMVCNMLEGTNPEQAKLYRQRLANLDIPLMLNLWAVLWCMKHCVNLQTRHKIKIFHYIPKRPRPKSNI
jgi:hypothetical protein